MKSLTVADCMNPNVISISDEATLREAVALMQEHRISALVVVDHAQHMVGVLSQTDVLRAWQQGGNYADVRDRPVNEFMTRDAVATLAHKPLSYALELLNRHRIHRLVVVESRDGGRFVTDRMRPIGILSQTDIVRTLVAKPELINASSLGGGGEQG